MINQVLMQSANADGVFRSACGKQYFISTLNTTKLEAETECCKYGLKLLAVESNEELACLADMNAGSSRKIVKFRLDKLCLFSYAQTRWSKVLDVGDQRGPQLCDELWLVQHGLNVLRSGCQLLQLGRRQFQ
jgi:hypothetical protein